MDIDLFSIVTSLVREYGALGIFVLSIFEEIFLPVPSSFTFMMAGFFLLPVSSSMVQFAIDLFLRIALPGAFGLAIGSFFFYFLGYVGGKPLVLRWGKWVRLSWEGIEKMEAKFRGSNKDEWALFMLRAIPIVPNIFISAFCGIIRYPFWTFFIIAFLGNILRGVLMALLGFFVGEAYVTFAERFAYLQHVLFGVILLCAIGFSWYIYVRKKRSR